MSRWHAGLRGILGNQSWVLTAAVLNLPLLCIVLGRNLSGVPAHDVATVYAMAAIVGYYGLALLLVVSALALALGAWRRVLGVVSGLAMAIAQWFLLVDGQVYSLYKFHVDFFWLGFVWKDATGIGITPAVWTTAIGALVAALLFEFGVLQIAWRVRHRLRVISIGFAVTLASFVASQAVHIVAYEKNDERITRITPRFPLYLPVRSHGNAVKYGHRFPGITQRTVESGSMESLQYPLSPVTFGPGPPARNLLVILIESWRADSFNSVVTPRLWEFGRGATVFDEHFSSGNSTIAGVFGLFYGIHPTYWETVKANSGNLHNPVLIDAMQDRGYDFGIFADSNFDRHKIQETVFADIEIHDEQVGHDSAERDRDLGRQVAEFLEARSGDGQPFMALAFFKASHFDYRYDPDDAPFQPTGKLNPALLTGRREPELYLNDYRNALHYDDRLVGSLLETLRSSGLDENTIVVVTTDHGESFGDDGANYWGHGSSYTRFQTQVPLVMKVPGRNSTHVTRRSSHLDVVPTLMRAMFGCTSPISDYSDGVDLFEMPPDDRSLVIASYFNHAMIFGDSVYESRPFGLKSYAIDDATRPASPVDPRAVRRAMAELTRFIPRRAEYPVAARLAGP